jgi:hypothetical protein
MLIYDARADGASKFGFFSNQGSSIVLESSSEAANSGDSGYCANSKSHIAAISPDAIDNTSDGFRSDADSFIVTSNPTVSGIGRFGFNAVRASAIQIQGTISGEASSPKLYSSSLGTVSSDRSIVIKL